MTTRLEDIGKQPASDLEAAARLMTGTRNLHAQRASEIHRELDRLIDRVQALAAEIDDGRSFAVMHVADKLTTAQDALRRTVVLLGVSL